MDELQQVAATPDWVAAEMPPGYKNRLDEIERLTRDLQAMWRFGRLLWASGPQLAEAVAEVFAMLKLPTEWIQSGDSTFLTVRLEGHRRLLLAVSDSQHSIEKKSSEVAEVFRMIHTLGDDHDRGVFVVNPHASVAPAARPEAVSPEATTMLKRLGVNILPGQGAFQLWTMALQDPERASRLVERLYEQDGGVFVVLPPGKAS